MADKKKTSDDKSTPPADLAEAALGVTQEQLQRCEGWITRFLRGEYLSLDEDGKIIAWPRAAEERFGWSAGEMTDEELALTLVASEAQREMRALIDPIVRGEKRDGPAAVVHQLQTHKRDGSHMTTEVAFVPIRIGDGYRLNLALQDIITHRGNPVEVHRMKKRHADVLRLIVTALDGGELPDPLEDDGWRPGGARIEERWQPAGALVIFEGTPGEAAAGGEAAQPAADATAGAPATAATAAAAAAPGGGAEADTLRAENDLLKRQVRALEDETERLRQAAGGSGDPDVDDPSVSTERLTQALREDGFALHAQPVLDLRTNEIAQHELLIRMVDTDGGLILPQAFFGQARRAGLTPAIDQWVIRKAIRTIAEQAKVGRDVRLEVNLSEESLRDAALLATIERELASTGVEPDRLVLEVTERAATADPDTVARLAKRVRSIGCQFALDDFGTSFGSFRFLKDLPVDYLKLDGDLIVTLSESRTAQLVVKALVDVARGTGAETIAVFASDDEALRMLAELGVDFAQGHKVGRPRPIADALSAVESTGLRAVDAGDQAAAGGTANLAT